MSNPRTTLYLRGMPVDLVREAKAVAARRGSTVAEVVCEAIATDLVHPRHSQDTYPPDPVDEIAPAMDWYERHRPALLKRHAGEYVAILDEKVVDHDPDFEPLAARVFARFGVRSVFMPRVEGSARRVVRVRSPRLVRK